MTSWNGLKRTPLKATKGLKKVSEKQAAKNKIWREITLDRKLQIIRKFGTLICEYCGKPESGHEIQGLPWDGHHIDGDRNNNTPENNFIAYRTCHSYITDHNLKVTQLDLSAEKE